MVGVVEPDAKLLASGRQSMPAYRDLPWMTEEQLLNVPGLQVVLVETAGPRFARHGRAVRRRRQARPSRQAGGRVAAAVSRAARSAAEKQKLLVQMGYMFRYSPAVVLMRKFLKEGWLGEVFEVHTVMSKVVPPAQRKELAEFRGGIMFELGCHVIDLVVGVLGRPAARASAVRAPAARTATSWPTTCWRCSNIRRPRRRSNRRRIEIDGGSRRHFVVCGTAGTFHIQPLDAPNVRLTLDRDRGEYKKGTHEVKFGNYERYVGDAADMARILRGEKECDYPLRARPGGAGDGACGQRDARHLKPRPLVGVNSEPL